MEQNKSETFLERFVLTISLIGAAFLCALMMWLFSDIRTQHIDRIATIEDTLVQK